MYASLRYRYSSLLSFTYAFILLFTSASAVRSQDASGLHLENYAGIHGIITNPAYGLHGLLNWDVNLFSAHLFLQNDYAFVTETNLFHILSNLSNVQLITDIPEGTSVHERLVLDFESAGGRKYFSALMDLTGPSFFLQRNELGIGVISRLRGILSTYRIPGNLDYYFLQNVPRNMEFPVESVQGGSMLWGELGLNFQTTRWSSDRSLSIGFTMKYLSGFEGMYGYTDGTSLVTGLNDDQALLENTQGELAYTSSFADHTNFEWSAKGWGIGLDVGISKKYERSRLGVSITDIGMIFFHKASERHQLSLSEPFVIPMTSFGQQESLDQAIALLNDELKAQGIIQDTTLTNHNFSLGLPTALRGTLDFQVLSEWFINLSIHQRLPLMTTAAKANNLLQISPRHEKRHFAISTPVIVHNYKDIRIGLSARIFSLILGTDDLISLFGRSSFNGSSIYMGLKINQFGTLLQDRPNSNTAVCPFNP